MSAKLLLLMLTTLCLNGCIYKHVDTINQFWVIGDVYDKTTNEPLDKVNISFVDIDFDSERSKLQISKVIGVSDGRGKIELSFDYWWGMERGLFQKSPRKLFDIEFSKEHYKSERLHFRESDLVMSNGKLVVPLRTVYLGVRLRGRFSTSDRINKVKTP